MPRRGALTAGVVLAPNHRSAGTCPAGAMGPSTSEVGPARRGAPGLNAPQDYHPGRRGRSWALPGGINRTALALLPLFLFPAAPAAAEPIERSAVVESFEVPSPIEVASGHQPNLSLERISEGAQLGKHCLKVQCNFKTNGRESYRLLLNRPTKREPLRVGLYVRGKTDGVAIAPVVSWMESNRRLWGVLPDSPPTDSEAWARLEFDLASLKDPKRSGFLLEGFDVRESADANKFREASSATLFIDEIDCVCQVSPQLKWELTFLTSGDDLCLVPEDDEVLLYAKLDSFVKPIPNALKISWEVTDASGASVASGEDPVANLTGTYAVQELRFRIGDRTGPYVATANCYAGPKPEEVTARAFEVDDPKLTFKFVRPKEHTNTKLATGFVPGEDENRVLRCQYKFTRGTGPRRDHFILQTPEEMFVADARLRSITLRINVVDLDEGFNDTRVALIIQDAGGTEIELPMVSLITFYGWKEITWEIPAWQSGLVRYPIRIKEVRFWETGPDSWGNMQAGCQGAFEIDYVKLTYDRSAQLRFSVANARTSRTQFAEVTPVNGDTFSYGACDAEGRNDQSCLQVTFKDATAQREGYKVRIGPHVPGSPMKFSLWAKTTMAKVTVRPEFAHKGHWAVTQQLPVSWKNVEPDGNWQLLEWEVPFSGTGVSIPSVWHHILVLPLRLEQILVQVPPKSGGTLLLDDLSFLTQLPAGERLSVAAGVRRVKTGSGTALDATVTNSSLKPVDATVEHSLSDAHGAQFHSGRSELRLSAGQAASLGLDKIDLEPREGPYRFVAETSVPGGEGKSLREQTLFVPNASALLVDFDRELFLNGATQTAEARKEGRYGAEISHGRGRANAEVTGIRRILPGYPMALGMWIKGHRNEVLVSVSGHDRGPNVTNFKTNPVLVDWEGWRHVTFELPRGVYPTETDPTTEAIDYPLAMTTISLGGEPKSEGKICIDEVSVVTQVQPAELVDVGLYFSLPSRIGVVGEPQQAYVENRSLTRPLTGTLQLEESALARRDQRSHRVKIALKPAQRVIVPTGSHFERAGPFRIKWTILSDKAEKLFEKTEDYLAMRLSPEELAEFNRTISDPYQLYRFGRVNTDTFLMDWNKIEPYPGDMTYERTEAELTRFLEACPGLIPRLGYTTFWNSPRGMYFDQYDLWEGDSYQYPKDLKAWYHYVYETVRRYKDRLTYWEVWNEPAKAKDEIDMSLSQYLRLLQIASVAIRQADPKAKVIMGSLGPAGMKGYLEQLLKEGAAQWLDIVGLHPVEGLLGPEVSFLEERVKNAVRRVHQHHPKAEVWVTSLVWPSSASGASGALTEHVQAEYMAKGKVLCLAAGAKRVLDHQIGIQTERESSRTVYQVRPRKIVPSFGQLQPWPNWYLKPSFLAVKTANEVLEGVRFRQEVLLPDRSAHYSRGYLFDAGSNEILAVLWRREGECAIDFASLPKPVRGMDAYGNAVSLEDRKIRLAASPLYLFFPASSLDRLVDELPASRLAYKDHPASLWKQNLIDWIDRNPERAKSHGYTVDGQVSEYSATGKHQADLELRAQAAKVVGTESFQVDLASLGTNDLLVVRRIDLDLKSQRVALKVGGREVARHDLSPLDRFTKHSEKRFYDLAILVPNTEIKATGKARVEFQALDAPAKGDGDGPPDEKEPGKAALSSVVTKFYAKKPGPLYLSDIDYVAAQQSQSVLRMDENLVGRTMRVQDQLHPKGLGSHAQSQVVYYLGGQFRKFRVLPGLDQSVEDGSVSFLVLADGKTVYESKEIVTPYSKTEPIEVDVSGCQVLELRVGDGGDGIQGDWACWADARLER